MIFIICGAHHYSYVYPCISKQLSSCSQARAYGQALWGAQGSDETSQGAAADVGVGVRGGKASCPALDGSLGLLREAVEGLSSKRPSAWSRRQAVERRAEGRGAGWPKHGQGRLTGRAGLPWPAEERPHLRIHPCQHEHPPEGREGVQARETCRKSLCLYTDTHMTPKNLAIKVEVYDKLLEAKYLDGHRRR